MKQIKRDTIKNIVMKKELLLLLLLKKPHLRKRLPRSSYAFAQQPGWGPLITSGIMQVKRGPYARASHDVNVCSILLDSFLFLSFFF
jgi:hypothetical protein